MRIVLFLTLSLTLLSTFARADLINEFEPNPAGGDPANQSVELSGTANASFDLWLLSIENDGYNGLVDRVNNVTGTFGSNGLAVVDIPDLENPSNTVILTDSFTGDTSTDIDPNNDGNLDLSAFGTIMDAVGVSDNAGDDSTMYGALLGGTDILFNGQFEPLTVFRDSLTNSWFNTVTVDFGAPTERLGVFDAAGNEVNAAFFDSSPFGTTFGSDNPGFTGVPEPSSAALVLTSLFGLAVMRRRQS